MRRSTPAPTPPAVAPADVKALRAFNRFYTQRIGVLKRYLDSDFTLTEVRVLYEVAHQPGLTAATLVRQLDLDAGYLSRILRRFEQRGWLAREASPHDARQSLLRLTDAGHAVFAPLQQKSRDEAAQLLGTLPAPERPRLLQALGTAQRLMAHEASDAQTAPDVTLRPLQPGDMGWVVQAHGEVYAKEYRYNAEFEALVAEIAARLLRRFDPAREAGWIAERQGQRVGSVFLVRKSARVAQLRLLVLTPDARGLGLGSRLTDAALDFARAKGYRKVVLWTHRQLKAARAIYQTRGFRLVHSEPHHAYGRKLVSETWELTL
ncbi:GNAT family N-acetyltransferase [Ramlibacter sp.]|uniref:bifunctional helix-turn-helix transcriptional regulator/GNAT family N-acetyltransferase n=1 Tax=Ramlibacter sp. TaxID=1917967 RepID=UPI0035AE971D